MKIGRGVQESSVIKEVQSIIELYDLNIWRNNTGAVKAANGRYIRFGIKGSADFIGWDKKGRFVAIECKRPIGGKLSMEQKIYLESLKSSGGVAIVATSGMEARDALFAAGCI